MTAESARSLEEGLQPNLLPVPDQEEAELRYGLAAREAEVFLPRGVSLGRALATLLPRDEYIFRARYGMYPYDERRTSAEIAVQLGLGESYIQEIGQSLPGRVSDLAEGSRIAPESHALEDLARKLEGATALDPVELSALRMVRGLPPHPRPLALGEASKMLSCSNRSVVRIVNRAMARLDGSAVDTALPPSDVYKTPKERRRIFRTIEAGWYAAGLLTLYEPEPDSDLYEDAVYAIGEGHARACYSRRRRRDGMGTNMSLQTGRRREVSPEIQDHIASRRGRDGMKDSIEGAYLTIHYLQDRAAGLSKEDASLLREVAAEGQTAEDRFFQANFDLVLYIATRRKGSLWDKVSDGGQGLLHAMRKYDDELGYAFSTYATQWIISYMQRGYYTRLGRMMGVGIRRAEEILRTKRLETSLAQDLQRMPTAQEIAESVGGKMTAKRVEENKELLAVTKHTRDPAQDKSPYTPKTIAAYGEVDERYEPLNEIWEYAFAAAGLSDEQAAMMWRLFEPSGGEYTIAELASERGVEVRALNVQLRTACSALAKAIGKDPRLSAYVAPFLRG